MGYIKTVVLAIKSPAPLKSRILYSPCCRQAGAPCARLSPSLLIFLAARHRRAAWIIFLLIVALIALLFLALVLPHEIGTTQHAIL